MKYKHSKIIGKDQTLGLSNLSIFSNGHSLELELPHGAAKFIQEYLESNIDVANSIKNDYHSIKPLPNWTGLELQALRESLGLELEAFRVILDITTTTLCAYERASSLPVVVSVALEYLVTRKLLGCQLTQYTYDKLIDKIQRLLLTGEQIRKARLSQEVTQETFGTKMHWSRKQVSYIENRSPSLSQSLYVRYFYDELIKF